MRPCTTFNMPQTGQTLDEVKEFIQKLMAGGSGNSSRDEVFLLHATCEAQQPSDDKVI